MNNTDKNNLWKPVSKYLGPSMNTLGLPSLASSGLPVSGRKKFAPIIPTSKPKPQETPPPKDAVAPKKSKQLFKPNHTKNHEWTERKNIITANGIDSIFSSTSFEKSAKKGGGVKISTGETKRESSPRVPKLDATPLKDERENLEEFFDSENAIVGDGTENIIFPITELGEVFRQIDSQKIKREPSSPSSMEIQTNDLADCDTKLPSYRCDLLSPPPPKVKEKALPIGQIFADSTKEGKPFLVQVPSRLLNPSLSPESDSSTSKDAPSILPSGMIGKLRIRRSGKVEIDLGPLHGTVHEGVPLKSLRKLALINTPSGKTGSLTLMDTLDTCLEFRPDLNKLLDADL